jgi:hypothetical protein
VSGAVRPARRRRGSDLTAEKYMEHGKPVDRPSTETVKVRQGTGPRAMVSVLLVSLLLAAIIGAGLLYYFLTRPALPPAGP